MTRMKRIRIENWTVMGLTAAGMLFGLFLAIVHRLA